MFWKALRVLLAFSAFSACTFPNYSVDRVAMGGSPSGGAGNNAVAAGSNAGGAGSNAGGAGSSTGGAGNGPAGLGGQTEGGSEASAGSGGEPNATSCSDLPLPVKGNWTVSASDFSRGSGQESDPNYNPPEHVTDGKLDERWSTGRNQAGDEWLQVDFGVSTALSKVTLMLGNFMEDHPRLYEVRRSDDSLDFQAVPVASGSGKLGTDLVVDLEFPSRGRYLLISQHGTSPDRHWSIAELSVECAD